MMCWPGWWCRCHYWRFSCHHVLPLYLHPPIPYFIDIDREIVALEDYKKHLESEKTSIEQEIKDVEARIRELKSKKEAK